jgi:hypothetical protein
VLQPNDEASPAPELDALALNQPPRLLDRFGIAEQDSPTKLTKCPSLPTKYTDIPSPVVPAQRIN